MPFVAEELEAPTSEGLADTLPVVVPAAADTRADLLRVKRLLARPVAGALFLSTAVTCTFITQHPLVVLAMMLCFPVLLVAQEQVEQRLRSLPDEVQPSSRVPIEAPSLPLSFASEALATAVGAPRRSLPQGMAPVAERHEARSPSAAA